MLQTTQEAMERDAIAICHFTHLEKEDIMIKRVYTTGLCLISFLCITYPVFAQWSVDPFINTSVTKAANDQNAPKAISDGAGGMITVWQDVRGSDYDIYAQSIDANGIPKWTADGVPICTAANDQTVPVIVSDGAGGAIISWSDSRNGNYDIYAQRINANGVVQWASDGVAISSAANDQIYSAITGDGADGAIIVWYDNRNGTDNDIYAQRINASGTVQWTANGVAICTQPDDQMLSVITDDGAGGAIIAWQDHRNATDKNIYAQRINAAGSVQWTTDGVAICSSANDQSRPSIISDDAGGAIIAWLDNRASSNDVFAQRIDASGAGQWVNNGSPICTATGAQAAPAIVSDGAGGAIMAWQDFRNGSDLDIYAQRITRVGVLQWLSDGVPVSKATNDQYSPTMVSDGVGGATVVWADTRDSYSNYNIYGQRINAEGSVVWKNDGIGICTAPNGQVNPVPVSDGNEGAIVVWEDYRDNNGNIYAQKLDPIGYLGIANPLLTSVMDVPGDQGGRITVAWNGSPYDVSSKQLITQYSIWRGVHLNSVQGNAHGKIYPKGLSVDQTQSDGGKVYRTRVVNGVKTNWELVGTISSHYLQGYSFTAQTTSDSTANGIPYFTFFVSAETADPFVFWDSGIDSSYSVDNLSPGTPSNFTGNVVANSVELHWNPNSEKDLSGYNIYRSGVSGFNPDTMKAYATTGDTAYTDTQITSGMNLYYVLRAVDIHGNQSASSNEVSILGTSVQDEHEGIPTKFALKAELPEPVQPDHRDSLRIAGEK